MRINNPDTISFSSFLTPIGHVFVAKSTKGICRISFPHDTENEFLHSFLQKGVIPIQRNDSLLKYEIDTLKAYFNGDKVAFRFPLDLSRGTQFQKRVWGKLQEIPYGECRSYKWVAEQIGQPLAARAVGLANNKNPLPPVVPCHRVIGSDGKLTGYASGLHIKKWLLELEYKTVSNSRAFNEIHL